MNIRISPRIIPGVAHNLNRSAIDWGWQGQLAYGCQNCVVIADAATMQYVQALDGHRSYVVKVRWARENYYHDAHSPYTLRLASADHVGRIVVWDVGRAEILADFSDGNKPIQEMEWLPHQDSAKDLLLALHPPYSLVLWRSETGQKLWKKSYTEILTSFALDPFDTRKLAFLGQDCIIFVDDFAIHKTPSSNGKKFYISSPSQSSGSVSGSSGSSERKPRTATTLRARFGQMLVGGEPRHKSMSSPDEDGVALNGCIQLTYHQAARHHLLLLYPRELLILDLEINQTVGVIPLERTVSPFSQIIPCRQKDALFCLHDNGSVSFRLRKRGLGKAPTPPSETVGSFGSSGDSIALALDVFYELRCQSDPLRLTKHIKVYGMALCPSNERSAMLWTSDGRVLRWDAVSSIVSEDQPCPTPLYSPPRTFPKFAIPSTCKLPLLSQATPPELSLSDLIGCTRPVLPSVDSGQERGQAITLRFLLTGLLGGVTDQPTVCRMCPPLTTKNFKEYQAIVAVGSSSGSVQLFDVSCGSLWREYSVHSHPVRGLEWVGLKSFLSYSHPTPGTASNLVKNDLKLVDIETGRITQFRKDRDDEPPIKMIRPSHHRQYLVVAFKEKPFELWDINSGNLLREMPKNFPNITALCWSPSHNVRPLKTKPSLDTPGSDVVTSLVETNLSTEGKSQQTAGKEHFVFTDTTGLLYHFIVEGNAIKDGSKIPPESGTGTISAVTWKGDTIILGDVDGNLCVWDLRARLSKVVPTHRGWVKWIKFAPGRGNMKLMVFFDDGVDIWDIKELSQDGKDGGENLLSVKSPRDIIKVVDCDWAGSDKPVILTADGCVRIVDLMFKTAMSDVKDYLRREPMFSPHLLPANVSFTLKYFLQHQPWNESFKFEFSDWKDKDPKLQGLLNSQLSTLDNDLQAYLTRCPLGVAERCLLTAKLFGDESDYHFWTLALHYLKAEKAAPLASRKSTLPESRSSGDLFIPGRVDSMGQLIDTDSPEDDWSFLRNESLETHYDVLCEGDDFQKQQLDRVSLHDSKRVTYGHTKKCAESLILLGQTDRAVQLLLETEADSDTYYIDCLKSCLVASIRSSGASQSTIKLVATNLIANGRLLEGVQLLCLIDKGLDACRYLQTYGEWHHASWLAKATLPYSDCVEVFRRWADHLCTGTVNEQSKALLVLLSLGQFSKVIEMTYGLQQFDRAAMFIEACREFGGLLPDTYENKILCEAVFLAYGRRLVSLGNRRAAVHYLQQAGEKGQLYMEGLPEKLANAEDSISRGEKKDP